MGGSDVQKTCPVTGIRGRRAGSMCPAAQGDVDPPCLPLRERWQREALAEGEIPHGFLSPSRLRRQPPPRGGLAARHRRADGTSYPKGICSAALHGRTPSPTPNVRAHRAAGTENRCQICVGRGALTPPRRRRMTCSSGAQNVALCTCPRGLRMRKKENRHWRFSLLLSKLIC